VEKKGRGGTRFWNRSGGVGLGDSWDMGGGSQRGTPAAATGKGRRHSGLVASGQWEVEEAGWPDWASWAKRPTGPKN
jgi:hypothetical protein